MDTRRKAQFMHIKKSLHLRFLILHWQYNGQAALTAEMTFTILSLNIISALFVTQIQREPYKTENWQSFYFPYTLKFVYIVISPKSAN